MTTQPTYIQIPTAGGQTPVGVSLTVPTVVVGPNGSGKSALLHKVITEFNGRYVYLPGSRPVSFDRNALNITPASKVDMDQNFIHWFRDPSMRFRASQFSNRNEFALHNLQSNEIQFKVDFADAIKTGKSTSNLVKTLKSTESPFERANRVLSQAGLPIRVHLKNSDIMLEQDGQIYSFAMASDGERSALLLLAEILTAEPGTLFAIDEPERHLHRSIIVPLIRALFQERADCIFVVSTHELALPEALDEAQVVVVRSCKWEGVSPKEWDITVLPEASVVPDDVRSDIIGARRNILFVEGKNTSLDQPLYAILFPSVSVIAKESCIDVRRAVDGLRATESLHHVKGYGIVDNDNMTAAEVAESELKSIFPLNMYSVESLYYDHRIIEALAKRQAETLGGNAQALADAAYSAALVAIPSKERDHLAAKRAVKLIRDAIFSSMPTKQTVTQPTYSLSVASPYAAERSEIDKLIAAKDVQALIDRYPLRETGALNAIAKALKFQSRADFEAAALQRLADDDKLANALRARLGKLAPLLSS